MPASSRAPPPSTSARSTSPCSPTPTCKRSSSGSSRPPPRSPGPPSRTSPPATSSPASSSASCASAASSGLAGSGGRPPARPRLRLRDQPALQLERRHEQDDRQDPLEEVMRRASLDRDQTRDGGQQEHDAPHERELAVDH